MTAEDEAERGGQPPIFASRASEISKLANTFCTSSCSFKSSISFNSFSPVSSSTATVFCGFQVSAALRG